MLPAHLIISSNYLLAAQGRFNAQMIYLDACEFLQIDPFGKYEELFIKKRIEEVRNIYDNLLIELFQYKLTPRRKIFKTLKNQYGKTNARIRLKEMNKLYKQEQKHVDKSRKNLIAAEFILLTMDKSEFDLFLSKLKSDTKKLGFVPSNDAVSQTWNYKGEGLSDTNSLLYRRLLKAKEKKIVLITLGILFLLIVVVSFVIYLVVKYY